MSAWSTFPCSTPTGTRCTTFTTAADILGVEKSPLLVVFFLSRASAIDCNPHGSEHCVFTYFLDLFRIRFSSKSEPACSRSRHFFTFVPIGISIIFTFKTNYSSSGLAFYLQTSFMEYRYRTGK